MHCPRGEDGATGEELRRETSKCLFMPNWAADEPAAVSDNSLSGREEETDAKEGKDKEQPEDASEERITRTGGVRNQRSSSGTSGKVESCNYTTRLCSHVAPLLKRRAHSEGRIESK